MSADWKLGANRNLEENVRELYTLKGSLILGRSRDGIAFIELFAFRESEPHENNNGWNSPFPFPPDREIGVILVVIRVTGDVT